MNKRHCKTVLVLGGNGFIGRYAVKHLTKLGANVLIGTRGERDTLRPGDRRCILHRMNHPLKWLEVLRDVDVVINAVGILRERKNESFEQVHHLAVATLAAACELKNIRLVHVSALGLDNPIVNEFALSKKRGERALNASGADWFIVRPSLVDAADGYGARWFRRIAQWPVHLAPANAVGIIAPINADELGEALANLSLLKRTADGTTQRVFEVSSGAEYTIFEYLEALAGKPATLRVRIPSVLARCAVFCLDCLHLTPLSFGHYELLQHRNAPRVNHLAALLGRNPTPVPTDRSSINAPLPAHV